MKMITISGSHMRGTLTLFVGNLTIGEITDDIAQEIAEFCNTDPVLKAMGDCEIFGRIMSWDIIELFEGSGVVEFNGDNGTLTMKLHCVQPFTYIQDYD